MLKLNINLYKKEYNIIIGNNILSQSGQFIRNIHQGNKAVILSDENVWNLYSQILLNALEIESIKCYPIVIKAGEESKNFDNFQSVLNKMADFKISRKDLFISFGGGVVGDLGGFCASVYMRGIDFVQIPTTLLSQVDSSVGGKTAINLLQGKNLVGTFYQPKLVISDTSTLKTLPKREFANGMAEVIKYAVLYSTDLFKILEQNSLQNDIIDNIDDIIYACCNFKKQAVEHDEFDNGERALLNLGHTFGHAIEKYGEFIKFNHGEGVALGMLCIALYSEMNNLSSNNVTNKIYNVCKKYNLPVDYKIDVTQLIEYFTLDKKTDENMINLILIRDIGRCFIKKENLHDFEKSMDSLQSYKEKGGF